MKKLNNVTNDDIYQIYKNIQFGKENAVAEITPLIVLEKLKNKKYIDVIEKYNTRLHPKKDYRNDNFTSSKKVDRYKMTKDSCERISKLHVNGIYCNNYKIARNHRSQVQNKFGHQKDIRLFRNISTYLVYDDVDICNCYMVIVDGLIRMFGVKNNGAINKYVNNRDKIIKDIIKINSHLDFGKTKQIILSILNGGGDYYKDKLIQNKTEWFKLYLEDVLNVTDQIVNLKKFTKDRLIATEIVNESIDKEDIDIQIRKKTLAYILGRYESNIVNIMLKHLVLKNCKTSQPVYINLYDGLLIRKGHTKKQYKAKFKIIQKEVKDTYGFKVTILQKDIKIPEDLRITLGLPISIELQTDEEINKNLLAFWDKTGLFLDSDNINMDYAKIINTVGTTMKYFGKHIANNDVIYIRSQCGSKKTVHTFRSLCNLAYKDCSILVITFRRSLGREFKSKLPNDFFYYEDLKNESEFSPKKYKRLICQGNSIHKITGTYDIVIIDEVGSLFSTILSKICAKKKEVFDKLDDLIFYANKLIVMDAYMNRTHVDYIASRRECIYQDRCVVLNNKREVDQFIGTVKFTRNQNSFMERIMNSVSCWEKLIIPSTSEAWLTLKLEAHLIDYKVDNPDFKYLIITRKSSLAEKDPTNWDKYDLVAYTPTIVAGISYNKHYFDKIYMYLTNQSCNAMSSAQMAFRVRNFEDKDVYVCYNQIGNIYNPETPEDVLLDLNRYANVEHKSQSSFRDVCRWDLGSKSYIDSPRLQLIIAEISYNNKSKNDFQLQFEKLMSIQGYKIQCEYEELPGEKTKDFRDKSKCLTETHRDMKNAEIEQIYKDHNIISYTEFNQLKNNVNEDVISDRDRIEMSKYTLYKCGFEIHDDMKLSHIQKASKNSYNIRFESDILNGNLNPMDEIDSACCFHSKLPTNKNNTKIKDCELFDIIDQPIRDAWLKRQYAMKLHEILTNSSDYSNCDVNINDKDDTLDRSHDYIIKHFYDLKQLYKRMSRKILTKDSWDKKCVVTLNSKLKCINRYIEVDRKGSGRKGNRTKSYKLKRLFNLDNRICYNNIYD
jgi:hypothetical protein